jgi:thiol:disulfide interchange protein
MRGRGGWLWLALAAFVVVAGCGPHGPHVSVGKLADLPTPLPEPYDSTATPAAVDAQIDAALAQAGREHKRVIVDFGGNWCNWCRMLASVMDLPEVKPFIAANFVVVPVEVASAEGKTDRNPQVLRRFGVTSVEGVPWLVVAEPDGKVVVSSDAVTDDAHHTPQTMVDWLAQWAPKPVARQS